MSKMNIRMHAISAVAELVVFFATAVAVVNEISHNYEANEVEASINSSSRSELTPLLL